MAAVTQSEELIDHDEITRPLMITVTAPATLPAGYTFEALLNDDPNRPFICEVVRIKNCAANLSAKAITGYDSNFVPFVLTWFAFVVFLARRGGSGRQDLFDPPP
jgi:hypothetical protein